MHYALGDVLYTGSDTLILGGTDPATGEQVAVKMPRAQVPSARALEKLRHEFDLLCQAEGPGVIRTRGLVPHNEGVALILERWPTSLDRILSDGPLPVETMLRLGAAIARALGHVHRCRVLHRDIKPHNILVNESLSDIRIIDFGVATRRVLRVDEAAANNMLTGTLAYVAPEQTGRLNLAVDARADLYSLGATLYHMATGVLPFEINDTLGLIHAHIAKTPPLPHHRAPRQNIPPVVSDIVRKLMEKSPEARYQTADGAAADIERAAEAWRTTGAVAYFDLATRDWQDRIRQPSALFGRDEERALLEESFLKACSGKVTMTLVAGPSGVGKSALVHGMRDTIKEHRGIFAPGKYDQLKRSTPYSALVQALRTIVRRRLADPPEVLEGWTAAWREAAGPNARILIDLMPELGRILGEPKPLLEVGPVEAKNRFQLTVKRFIRAIATEAPLLVLFLDDLQWADLASLVLLREILTDDEGTFLYVIGAYRSEEVGADHPLHALVAAVREKGIDTPTISLRPLDQDALSLLVADMLERPAAEVLELAKIVKEKTEGSPFFVAQFLHALHEHRLLSRDSETGAWSWQIEAIERAGITDNVAVILTNRLRELLPAIQGLLHTAACIGGRFDPSQLAQLVGQPLAEVRELLEEAAREGLIVAEAEDSIAFVHDRVQQVAYEARSPEERLQAHLAIGRKLRALFGASCSDDDLLTTLYHRNRSAELLTDAEEKRDLAEQNLRAGQLVKASTAYAEAFRFLKVAQGLLGEKAWDKHPELAFETHLALAETAWLLGFVDEGEALFRKCSERAADHVARGRAVAAWLSQMRIAGHLAQGIQLGLETLQAFGWFFPIEPEAQGLFLQQMLGRVLPKIAAIDIKEWQALPPCKDREAAVAGALLAQTSWLTALGNPALSPCFFCAMVEHTLAHGISSISAFGMACLAVLCVGALGEPALGAKCFELAMALKDREDITMAVATYTACLAGHYVLPLARIHTYARDVIQISEQEGDIASGEYGKVFSFILQMRWGVPLGDAHLSSGPWRDQMPKETAPVFLAARQALCRRDTAAGLASVKQMADMPTTSASAQTHKLGATAFVAMHLSEDTEALMLAALAEPMWLAAWCNVPDVWMLQVLTILGPTALDDELKRRVAAHRARLEKLAAFNPATFSHTLLLADACKANALKLHDDAERLYEEAIDSAKKNGFISDEALALRLAGEYYLTLGKRRVGSLYLREACTTYERWGAYACAARIRAKHADDYLEGAAEKKAAIKATEPSAITITAAQRSSTATSEGEARFNTHLDAASVLRAAHALAADRDLNSLIGRMLRLLAENAGAVRAVLALSREGELRICAELTLDPEAVLTKLDEPIAGSPRLPESLVQYVTRGETPIVLAQASGDSRFDEDPYLRAHSPASILAVPLVHQGRSTGVAYLEHPRVANAFPEERVELVTLLATQAATAVENAVLYADLQASNVRLEKQVEERTFELRAAKDAADRAREAADAANQAKSDFLSSMSHVGSPGTELEFAL